MSPTAVLHALCLFAAGMAFTGCGASNTEDNPERWSQHGSFPDAGLDAAPDGAGGDTAAPDAAEDGSEPLAEAAAQDAAQDGPEDPAAAAAARDAIIAAASTSSCYDYQWKDRGQMPSGYLKGVTLVFARAVCSQSRSDVVVVSQANTGDDAHDALSWYSVIFADQGMANDVDGVDTLRHAYTLLLGLGMRESSGEHCCGRDASATNTTADTAEAGAWQTSWNSHVFSDELPALFDKYRADASGCLLDVFEQGVSCSASNWESWGSGDGFDFQELEKSCPAFAAEYAAVMLRVSGGSSGHYGPLRTRAAEVRPECDALFQQVQALVEQTPSVCGLL